MTSVKTTKKPAAKTASPFSAAFLSKMEGLLKADEKRIERELNKFAKPNDKTVDPDDYNTKFPNFGDKEDENAAEVAEYAANLSIEDDLEKSLRDVKTSLTRIKNGSYGICKYCKKTIEERRLEARPTSSACVECKKAITQEM